MQAVINYLLSLLFLVNSVPSVQPQKTTVLLTGDVMLGRSVMITSLEKNDPTYPFQKVADKLKNADIVFANLENPIVANCPFIKSGFKFCADPKMVEGLKFAGVDIVSLANNHTLNFGHEGLNQTEKILTDNGIKWVGDNNLEVIEKNGIKFGFLGFDYVDNRPKEDDYGQIRESKGKVDVLIVMVHWGVEYTTVPGEFQKTTAKKLVEAGADVVTGAHPHSVQGTEFISGKPVFYSLGNFVFDQGWSEGTKNGLVKGLTYEETNLVDIKDLPIYMQNLAQPMWVE